jgi:outer membrane lipoprotein LolB
MSASRFAAMAVLLSLAGCAAQPVRQPSLSPPTALQIQAQAQRVAVLSAHSQWTLQGRVALSNGRQGGSGRIDWQQDGSAYSVSLSAPITRQSWRLTGDGRTARLEGLDGGPRESSDAQALLRETTGWVIPVSALGAWVRGMAAPGLPTANLAFDATGHLARIEQGGWTIDYSSWQPQPSLGIELPHRLDATQQDARVRLVIDAWQDGASAP